jgi:hypothetical protein
MTWQLRATALPIILIFYKNMMFLWRRKNAAPPLAAKDRMARHFRRLCRRAAICGPIKQLCCFIEN